MHIHISIRHHFPSVWRTSFNFSYSKKVCWWWILSTFTSLNMSLLHLSFWKHHFTGYRSFVWLFFSFSTFLNVAPLSCCLHLFFPSENSAVILLFVLLYITLLFSQAVSLMVFQTSQWERAQFPGLGAHQTLFPLILSGESCSASSSFPHPCHSQCWAAHSRGSTEVPVFSAASALLSGVPACDF